MGIPKHGKDSSRSRSSKKYKDSNHYAINKSRHIAAQDTFAKKQQAKAANRQEGTA